MGTLPDGQPCRQKDCKIVRLSAVWQCFKVDSISGSEANSVHGGHPEAAGGCLKAIQKPPESTFVS